GEYKGKIVEKNSQGVEIRPLDISITKNTFSLLLSSFVLIVIMLSVTRFYKSNKHKKAPGGFIGMMEVVILTIYEDVVIKCVGKDYKRYAPYLLTVFFFVLFNNLMGLIPIFPGGANVTGNIAITLVLSICTFIAINVFGTKEYWKEILWPEVPVWMKLPIPMMPVLELVGIFTKPFALTIRLMANIMAGHAAVLGLTSLVFVTVSMGPTINTSMTIGSVLFCVFMNCIELLVAFIQAYVFTMLSAVFIGLSRVESHHKKKTIE
ncbi:MAG: F0F1 ATP synthase subunit A, partial [Bacteroidales bacterium]|nr:F0F1 ATP synthase subunit A [Bacteroidales bacterium]